MNILHVSLGLPPLRTGGLNRYCIELMEAQVEFGDNVSLLFPGRFLPGKVRFRTGDWRGVRTYELINPLPVALTYGIAEPDAFDAPCHDEGVFAILLADAAPDVVHVHSYMGIYREFFHVAKAQGIPMVFTTHDYYPMCLRCTFTNARGLECVEGAGAAACAACCHGGMTLRKSIAMQSGAYAHLKSSGLGKRLARVAKRDMAVKGEVARGSAVDRVYIDAYKNLLDYNKTIFDLFDLILANSVMAEAMYRKVFPEAAYRLQRISHAGLTVERRATREVSVREKCLAIGYFGGCKAYKGFETLMTATRLLHEEGVHFELRLYGDDYEANLGVPEVRPFGRVASNKIGGILRGLDVVVVPSICHETFGFVVLEALCAGVAVICSNAVGASELVDREYVFHAGDAFDLAGKVKKIITEPAFTALIPSDYPISMLDQVTQLRDAYQFAIDRRGICAK